MTYYLSKPLKILLISSFVVLLSQCKEEVILEAHEEELISAKVDSFFVSTNEAIDIAAQFNLEQQDIQSKEGNADPKKKSQNRALKVKKLEAVSENEEDLFYVINYEDGSGWAIISADKRVDPVLAYSEEGSFEIQEPLGGVEQWIDFAKKEIKEAKKQKKAEPEIEALWKRFDKKNKDKDNDSDIGARSNDYTNDCNPYLTPCPPPSSSETRRMTAELSEWGQGEGYNTFSPARNCGRCERANTGCGPVAIAQIMRYYRKPSNFNYNIMPMTIAPNPEGQFCNTVPAAEAEVARLIRFAGVNTGTSYTTLPDCNTFTEPTSIKNAFRAAGYSNPGKIYDFISNLAKVRLSLQSGNPVIIMGTTCSSCVNPAHIWVLDGYRRSTYYELRCDHYGSRLCMEYTTHYYHLNWGWSGRSNAWFKLHNFRTRQGEVYDSWLKVHMDVRP
jgi:hypothetical protein